MGERDEQTPAAERHADGGVGSAPNIADTRVYSVGELLAADCSRLAGLLPEETRTHLKNAGSEAMLALYHLWKSIDTARSSGKPTRVRRHIEVE